jgi:predicted DNA-binding transcriptional regulator YafY
MNVNIRIQWFHSKILEMGYPNAMRLAERFQISHRQAQRDVDHMVKALGAPLIYSKEHKGYYYAEPYTLPVIFAADNDPLASLQDSDTVDPRLYGAESGVFQMQLPYTATIKLCSKLSALELNNYIVTKLKDRTYICEFHHVEKFLTALLVADADIKLLEPEWLREKLVAAARRVLKNNEEQKEG